MKPKQKMSFTFLFLTVLVAVSYAVPQQQIPSKGDKTYPPAAHIAPNAHDATASGIVIPGPGMPSLASLGVTSAQLASPDFKPPHSSTDQKLPIQSFIPSVDQQCFYDNYTASRGNAIACRNYLLSLQPGTSCSTNGGASALLVSAGDAELVAWNPYNIVGGVSTTCEDAAVAASWIVDYCSPCAQDTCQIEGQAPAQMNTNFWAYIGLY